MAACGSIHKIFDSPLPENQTLMESLSSWNQIKSVKPIEQSSFTEIFGELHFKENSGSFSSSSIPPLSSPALSSSLPSSFIDLDPQNKIENIRRSRSDSVEDNKGNKNRPSMDSSPCFQGNQYVARHKNNDSFSTMNSESLQLCTEGLGFESSDDIEDLTSEINNDGQNQGKASATKNLPSDDNQCSEFRRSRSCGGAFPPPISCISKTGKPWVSFKSFRHNGRFVLKEIRVPTQEFLQACRENGRLKLHFVHPPEEEFLEEEEEEEEEEKDDNDDDIEEADEGEENEDEDHGADDDDAEEWKKTRI